MCHNRREAKRSSAQGRNDRWLNREHVQKESRIKKQSSSKVPYSYTVSIPKEEIDATRVEYDAVD